MSVARIVGQCAIAVTAAAAIAGCILKRPPDVADLQREALPHTTVPAEWKG